MNTEPFRQELAECIFEPAAGEAEIAEAEAKLGVPIPPVLRTLYSAFNGCHGPTSEWLLVPLSIPDQSRGDGLVELNRWLRGGWEFPHALVSEWLFFGTDGCGSYWGVRGDRPGQVISWYPGDGDEFKVAGDSPIGVWRDHVRL